MDAKNLVAKRDHDLMSSHINTINKIMSGYHYSSKRGEFYLVSEMDDNHLINAIEKIKRVISDCRFSTMGSVQYYANLALLEAEYENRQEKL